MRVGRGRYDPPSARSGSSMSAASKRILLRQPLRASVLRRRVSSVRFAERAKILGELVHLLRVHKFPPSRLRRRRIVLYRRLKFGGQAERAKFHTSIKFHFRSRAEVKRKTQLHAPLDALRKITLFTQRSFGARMLATVLKFLYRTDAVLIKF